MVSFEIVLCSKNYDEFKQSIKLLTNLIIYGLMVPYFVASKIRKMTFCIALKLFSIQNFKVIYNLIDLSVLQVLMKQIKCLITTVAMVKFQIQSLVFKVDNFTHSSLV